VKRQGVGPGTGGGPSGSGRRAMGTASRQVPQITSTEACAVDRRLTGASSLGEPGDTGGLLDYEVKDLIHVVNPEYYDEAAQARRLR
jgi:hypothetical protein